MSRSRHAPPEDCANPDCASGTGGDPLTGYCGTCLMQISPLERLRIESRMERQAPEIEGRAAVTPGWGS